MLHKFAIHGHTALPRNAQSAKSASGGCLNRSKFIVHTGTLEFPLVIYDTVH